MFGLPSWPVVAVIAALGAAPAGWLGYKSGHFIGYRDGFKTADKQAEVNDLKRLLAERERDLSVSRDAAERANQSAADITAQRDIAAADLEKYRAELERLAAEPRSEPAPPAPVVEILPGVPDAGEPVVPGPPAPAEPPPRPSIVVAGSCLSSDADVRWLQRNHFRPQQDRRPHGAPAPGRR